MQPVIYLYTPAGGHRGLPPFVQNSLSLHPSDCAHFYLQLPYLPEYKIAPEWHTVLELVHEQQQLIGLSQFNAAAQHLQLHQRIINHEMVQQLQLHHAEVSVTSHNNTAADAVQAAEESMHRRHSKLVIGVHFPEIPQSELQHASYNISSYNPAAAAVADWQHQLADIVAADGRCEDHLRMCQPELIARGPLELDVAVCPQVQQQQAAWRPSGVGNQFDGMCQVMQDTCLACSAAGSSGARLEPHHLQDAGCMQR